MSIENRWLTSSDQQQWQTETGVKCTARTVQNRLLHAGLKSYKAKKKPFISEKQRRATLKFAKDHRNWTVADWSQVIFSDESNFQLCPTPGLVMVRRRPGEAYNPQCLAPTVKYGGQCTMPYSQSNQSLDGGPPDQDPVMASLISIFEPY
ncbi:hypothetical protein QTP86_029970 [Hemibagrus guttatus]|nr:hypothetical protein QTP86_029970 [Hemibagrus guttatus]